MNEKKPEIIPVQYIPIQSCYEEDEIDLRELVKIILRYKKFIFVFTGLVTLIALVYVLLKKPIYEIKATITPGYINIYTKNGIEKSYFIDPNSLKIYIKNSFDNSNNPVSSYPKVEVSFVKGTKDLLNLKIDDFSNQKAIEYLNKILSNIHKKEDRYINEYKKNNLNQIEILKNTMKNLKRQLKTLNKKMNLTKDSQLLSAILDAISKIQNQLVTTQLRINKLQEKISPLNIKKAFIIGKIETLNHPIKPKKKLIVIVAFITGLILSIFLVFFIEFIKNLKEEDLQKS